MIGLTLHTPLFISCKFVFRLATDLEKECTQTDRLGTSPCYPKHQPAGQKLIQPFPSLPFTPDVVTPEPSSVSLGLCVDVAVKAGQQGDDVAGAEGDLLGDVQRREVAGDDPGHAQGADQSAREGVVPDQQEWHDIPPDHLDGKIVKPGQQRLDVNLIDQRGQRRDLNPGQAVDEPRNSQALL